MKKKMPQYTWHFSHIKYQKNERIVQKIDKNETFNKI